MINPDEKVQLNLYCLADINNNHMLMKKHDKYTEYVIL